MNKVMIGDELSRGWQLYKKNFGLLFGATLVSYLIGGAICGILIGPMTIGLYMLIGALIDKPAEKPAFSVIFNGFDKFGAGFVVWLLMTLITFLLSTVVALLPFIGAIASVLVSFAGSIAQHLALLFVTRRGMTGMEAIKEALRGSFNGTYLNFLLSGIVFSLVGAAGVLACGIGVLFTAPLFCVCMMGAYKSVFESESGAPSAEPAPSPAPSPAA